MGFGDDFRKNLVRVAGLCAFGTKHLPLAYKYGYSSPNALNAALSGALWLWNLITHFCTVDMEPRALYTLDKHTLPLRESQNISFI